MRTFRGGVTLALGLVALLAIGARAHAYDRYSVNRDATNCRACHGDFRAASYTSLADNASWGVDLHDLHRSTMLGGDCNTCHSGTSRSPVLLDTSTGGQGLPAVSCVGCHGRAEDDNAANPDWAPACGARVAGDEDSRDYGQATW